MRLAASIAAWALIGGAVAQAAGPSLVYERLLTLPLADDPIGEPLAVTADPVTGEVFVCDARRDRVLIFDRDGILRFEINGGRSFSSPVDLAVDPAGYLLLLAYLDSRLALLELDFDGLMIGEVRLSELPAETVEPAFTSVALSPAGDLVYLVDAANFTLWIAARDGRVQASVDLAAGMTAEERADAVFGKVDVFGDVVLLAVPTDGTVRMFGLDGSPLGSVGQKGTAPCQLAFPTAAAREAGGDLVVVDQQRMLVMRWRPPTNRCLGEYLGMGSRPGLLYYPFDVSLDAAGRLYVSQGFGGRVQRYGGFPPAAGAAANAAAADDAPAVASRAPSAGRS